MGAPTRTSSVEIVHDVPTSTRTPRRHSGSWIQYKGSGGVVARREITSSRQESVAPRRAAGLYCSCPVACPAPLTGGMGRTRSRRVC